jgi:serine/threonine protein kinase/TolB-like protein/Flp pilus assembly protein TadD
MNKERWLLIERTYHAALEREGEARSAFLNEACAGDEELRSEVEGLITHDGQASSFIEAPALEIAAREMANDSLDQEQSQISNSPPAPQRIGPYKLLAPLGRGGMGEVHLALDTRLNRKVAIKLLPAAFTTDAERVRRFEQEARAASALNHPNILTIYEIGRHDSHHFMVTEFIEGETLRQRMTSAHLTLQTVLEVGTQIASALGAAHDSGIVHRDIKPENIMLRPDGYVKVLDFGLAKLTEPQATASDTQAPTIANVRSLPGMVLGTVTYMSPEQARGLEVDARTDIFSLGVVLYEVVAGRAPFEGATMSDVIAAILGKDPPPLARYWPEVPAELERIVAKALRKDREERYQTVKDMALDLKELKQRLEFESQVERSTRPVSSGGEVATTGGVQTIMRNDAQPASVSGEAGQPDATVGARRFIGHITRQKLAALVALPVVIAAAGIALYLMAGKTQAAIDSIAVLPFVNQNRDPETDYLSDGLTESIINNLTQLSDLRVIARSSVFRYKGKEDDPFGAAKQLGVRAVVVGRVLQRGESLMVSAELVDVRENKQLWGQQYNRKTADIFAVQGEIAKEISEKLHLKLTGAERQQLAKRPTENLKAFQYYMQGRAYAHRRTREDLLEAVRYCEKAIEEDRNYALAYAGLADAYTNLGSRGYVAPQEGRRKAEEAAHKALALDENVAEAHATLGQAYTLFSPSNFSLGDRELRRAIELSPSLAVAYHYLGVSLVRQGRLDEGSAELLKARELDPLSPIIARAVGLPYYLKGDYGRALEVLRQANELGPAFTTVWEVGVYTHSQLFDEALAELEKAKQERKSDSILIYNTAMVYAAQGRRAEALKIIKELEEMSGQSQSQAHWIAKIYAALNEKELALTGLERSLAAGPIGGIFKDEPVWDTIRSDPRFADLLRRMGIPQ